MTPRQKLILTLPLVAGLVIVLVYLGAFDNPIIIAAIFVLWVVVSLRNRKKFQKQEDEGP